MKQLSLNTRSLGLVFTVLCGQVAAIGMARLALAQPVLALGLMYAVGFWIVAWKRPHVALMLIFASAPLQNDLGGTSLRFSLAEVHLGLALPVVLLKCWAEKRRLVLGPAIVPVLLYLAVCFFSSLQTWRGGVAANSLLQMILYMVIAVGLFASLPRDERDFLPAFNLLVVVCIALVVLGSAVGYPRLGLNKNGIGASLACAVLVCIEMWFSARDARSKLFAGAALAILAAGLMLTVSRGSWLGAFVGIVFICLMRRQVGLMLRAFVVLLPVIVVSWNLLPAKTQAYATGFETKRYNIQARYESVDLARSYYEKNTTYGSGVGLRKTYDATNVQWLTLAETGVLGLFCFMLIHVVFITVVWRARHKFSRDDPRFSLLCIGGALMLYKLAHGSVDHYWSRGALTIVWAGVGMAAYACAVSRQKQPSEEMVSFAPIGAAPQLSAPVPAHEYS